MKKLKSTLHFLLLSVLTILSGCVAGIMQEGAEETARISNALNAKIARESSQRNQEILKQQQSIQQEQGQGYNKSLDENIKFLQRLQKTQQQNSINK